MVFNCPTGKKSFHINYFACARSAAAAVIFIFSAINTHAQLYNETVKSLFIYSFTRYIDWPYIKSGNTFNIGVVGQTNIYNSLNQTAPAKRVQDLPVKILAITKAEEAKECHLVFVAKEQSTLLKEIIGILKGKPALIVTEDMPADVKDVGINIFEHDKKIKFTLYDDVIKNAGLKISTELINLSSQSH